MLWSPAELGELESVQLGPCEVVYAYIRLGGFASAADIELLDPEERARSDRFAHAVDRSRFTIAHASLRVILARCTAVRPLDIRYELGPHGKPRLGSSVEAVEFNMAHSHDVGLVAVSRDSPIGVDVERIREIPDAMALAESNFTKRERSILRAAPGSQRSQLFLRYWTRKEAIIKASGEGLSRELTAFDVDTAPRSITVRGVRGEPEDSQWMVQDLAAPGGFVASGAAAAGDAPIWREVQA